MKRIFNFFAVLILAASLASPTAFAKNDLAKESLVALGDSIPFGLNLGKTNQNPAKFAYPFLIGAEEDLRVRNLGVSGWQSGQLLDALQDAQKYRQALKKPIMSPLRSAAMTSLLFFARQLTKAQATRCCSSNCCFKS